MLGLENCVDFLSSVVVLWRFFAPSKVTSELEAKLKSREKRASVAISMILVLLGLGIWITSFEDLSRGQEVQDPRQQSLALAISFFSFVLFCLLAVFKFHYANALDSPSLYKDGICSMIGTILSASLFINTLIIKAAPSAWWIDPVVAIGCGLASLIYGMRTLYTARHKDKLPIFSCGWWLLSYKEEDDHVDEPSGRITEMTMRNTEEEHDIA